MPGEDIHWEGTHGTAWENGIITGLTLMNRWLTDYHSVCRRMPLPQWLHEGPGPQAPLHPQWMGAQSGVSNDNHLKMVYDFIYEEEMLEGNHSSKYTCTKPKSRWLLSLLLSYSREEPPPKPNSCSILFSIMVIVYNIVLY